MLLRTPIILLSMLGVPASPRCTTRVVRQEWHNLPEERQDAFLQCVMRLYESGAWEVFAERHARLKSEAHGNLYFLPSHRSFMHDVEDQLRAVGCNFGMPYYDSGQRYSDMFRDEQVWAKFGNLQGCLEEGPLAGMLRSDGSCLNRQTDYRNVWATSLIKASIDGSQTFQDFATSCENGYHPQVHNGVGGCMRDLGCSAWDPFFLLHHTYVDYLWAYWQGLADGRYEDYGSLRAEDAIPSYGGRYTVGMVTDYPNQLCYEYEDVQGRREVVPENRDNQLPDDRRPDGRDGREERPEEAGQAGDGDDAEENEPSESNNADMTQPDSRAQDEGDRGDSRPRPESEPEPERKPEQEEEEESEPGGGPEPESGPAQGPEPESEPGGRPESESGPAQGPEPESEPGGGPGPESEPGRQQEPGRDSSSTMDPDLNADATQPARPSNPELSTNVTRTHIGPTLPIPADQIGSPTQIELPPKLSPDVQKSFNLDNEKVEDIHSRLSSIARKLHEVLEEDGLDAVKNLFKKKILDIARNRTEENRDESEDPATLDENNSSTPLFNSRSLLRNLAWIGVLLLLSSAIFF